MNKGFVAMMMAVAVVVLASCASPAGPDAEPEPAYVATPFYDIVGTFYKISYNLDDSVTATPVLVVTATPVSVVAYNPDTKVVTNSVAYWLEPAVNGSKPSASAITVIGWNDVFAYDTKGAVATQFHSGSLNIDPDNDVTYINNKYTTGQFKDTKTSPQSIITFSVDDNKLSVNGSSLSNIAINDNCIFILDSNGDILDNTNPFTWSAN